ncbi:ubiquitin-like domain-containing protein [uncultured Cellulomonas sp.]|uniref:ubiquitin-like domain-containing protein n=1 Tax=uncultured Cellulomonas sp. TaxID=189682 RepID=UPI0028E778AD|nr:ubiquitin-like domain-containing protein [uncultured Cellulomonas sp.]
MPGHLDGWSPVQFSTLIPGLSARSRATSEHDTPDELLPTDQRSGRTRVLPITAAAVALVLAGGSAAFAHAQKSVTLDVDGEISQLSTFAGSVDGLLEDQGVVVGARDTVSSTGTLGEGAEIVVRHAHQVSVSIDGQETAVWTTALSADEALESLAARGQSVALVASRSAAGGRPELALDLALSGPADVLVDGTTLAVPDADASVAQVLGELGITLNPLDRVSVAHDATGRVQVIVNRVAVQDVTSTHEVAFASSTQQDPARYTDQKRTLTAGVPGVRTLVERVTTVDGVETGRVAVSDAVTQAPVDEVLSVGTKARPVVVKASAAPATGTPVTAGGDADSLNWAALARCESGGNPTIVSATGKYHGLYQFSVSTWAAVGGAGLPSQATPEEQTARAKMLYNRSGAGQWPHCGKNLFT